MSFLHSLSRCQRLFAAAAVLIFLNPCVAFACGTPQTQILSVGDPSKDKRCGFDSIQKAIDAATCPGTTILVTRAHPYTAQKLVIKSKSLLIAGATQCGVADTASPATRTTIDGTGNGGRSVFTITGGADILLQNLWITGGNRTDSWSTGGAIDDEVTKGSLTLDNTVVTLSSAWYGGGIYMRSDAGSLDIEDNVLIEFNTGNIAGGGVSLEGNVTMSMVGRNSGIYSNTVTAQNGGGYGGGISVLSPSRLNLGSPGIGFGAGAVESNSALYGGGIALGGVYGCTGKMQMFTTDPLHPTQISNNIATKSGGAMYLAASLFPASLKNGLGEYSNPCTPDNDQVDLHDFRIVNNSAPDGSAVQFAGFGSVYFVPDDLVADNPAGGPILNLNISSLSDAGVTRYGAVACAKNVECNVFSGNVAQAIDPKSRKPTPTAGATISAQEPTQDINGNPGFFGIAGIRFNGNRFRMHDNVGGNLIVNRYDDSNSTGIYQNHFVMSECLFTKNRMTLELLLHIQKFVEPEGSNSMALGDCTIADNTIGVNNAVITYNNTFDIENSIVSQPGLQAAVLCIGCGNILTANNLVGEDLQGLFSGATTLETDPLFVDRNNNDFGLKATSPAADFTLSSAGVDLQGNQRSVDLAEAVNRFGPRDLGALERQIDVASAASGSTAVASSTFDPVVYPAAAAIDGDRTAVNGVNAGFWNDATAGVFPDILQVNFNALRQIGKVDVYSLQDAYMTGVDPSETLTGAIYVMTGFDVQYLDPATSNWITIQSVNGNHFIKREIVLSAQVTTSAIRIVCRTSANPAFSRIVEVEAFAG